MDVASSSREFYTAFRLPRFSSEATSSWNKVSHGWRFPECNRPLSDAQFRIMITLLLGSSRCVNGLPHRKIQHMSPFQIFFTSACVFIKQSSCSINMASRTPGLFLIYFGLSVIERFRNHRTECIHHYGINWPLPNTWTLGSVALWRHLHRY
jgi:hypothetical protein